MIDDSTWSKERLLQAVKDSHPLLANMEFAYTPDWTTANVPDDVLTHNLAFTIIDPDNSIASQVVNSPIIMFATHVTPVSGPLFPNTPSELNPSQKIPSPQLLHYLCQRLRANHHADLLLR